MATKVDSRGGDIEKEVEWEQRVDQARKELLSSR